MIVLAIDLVLAYAVGLYNRKRPEPEVRGVDLILLILAFQGLTMLITGEVHDCQ